MDACCEPWMRMDACGERACSERVRRAIVQVAAPCHLSLYPTPPAAPRKDDYIPDSDSDLQCSDNRQWLRAPPAYIFCDGQLMFHKEYQGRMPFTYVDEGGRHDWYGVHTDQDLVLAQQLNLVLQRHFIPRRATPASTR
jgi:hypothetical protein